MGPPHQPTTSPCGAPGPPDQPIGYLNFHSSQVVRPPGTGPHLNRFDPPNSWDVGLAADRPAGYSDLAAVMSWLNSMLEMVVGAAVVVVVLIQRIGHVVLAIALRFQESAVVVVVAIALS